MRDAIFTTPAIGPDAASWATACVRALHPLRWASCAVGLAATVAIVAVSQSLFDGEAPRFADWFRAPGTQAQAFAEQLADRSVRSLIVRLSPVLVVVAGVWSITGCWIARHELLARHRGPSYSAAKRIEPGPTRLVTRRLKQLLLCCPSVLSMCALLILPVVLAGLLNHLGGVGAILVAVLLPVVLLADLIFLLIAVGLVAWPLMPVTIAAEYSDVFDALSRAYNYMYMRPVRFIFLTITTIIVAVTPLAAVLLLLAGPVENWLPAVGHPVVWVAAALSASIYWSLQTLAYLHLRTAMDGVDANELARETGVEEAASSTPPKDGHQKPKNQTGVLSHVMIFVLMVGTWVLTAWLFARFGGENAGWLGWGMGERFRPDTEGLYSFASLVAAGWGFIWIAAPILVAIRRAIRPETGPVSPPTSG